MSQMIETVYKRKDDYTVEVETRRNGRKILQYLRLVPFGAAFRENGRPVRSGDDSGNESAPEAPGTVGQSNSGGSQGG